MRPDVSILLLTRNGGGTLGAVLDAIEHQRTSLAIEIVAVDSGSTDGTLELLRRRVTRTIAIAPGEFDHGMTRNLGMSHCLGPLVVLLVQDAVPESSRWLDRLVGPLLADEDLAGTYARQVARSDASPITRQYLVQSQVASLEPKVSELPDRETFDRLTPRQRFDACTFDNVCSCVRRSVWESTPFKKTTIAEDLEWARDVLLSGYRLAYVPQAVVVHSHDRSARYELGRTYLLHRRLRQLFNMASIPDLPCLAVAIASSVPRHLRWLLSESRAPSPLALARALALAVAFPLGQYLGTRSADTGREFLRPRNV